MPDPRHASLPLSAAQAGIWLGQQLDPSNPAYNTAECIEILGNIKPAAFERAVRLAVGEAEALHARFVMDGDEPRQVLEPSADWEMPVIDLSAVPDPWQAAQAWMTADLGKVIDLSQGPLFAQALFKAAGASITSPWTASATRCWPEGWPISTAPWLKTNPAKVPPSRRSAP
jgi:nonribosomal peptide synthetase MxcG